MPRSSAVTFFEGAQRAAVGVAVLEILLQRIGAVGLGSFVALVWLLGHRRLVFLVGVGSTTAWHTHSQGVL